MAGSAGSPPVLTVYVCPCGRWYGDVVYDGHDGGWLCAGLPPDRHSPTEMQAVEYVPREQSDALVKAIRRFLTVLDPDDADRRLLGEALNSYREATAGEGDDGSEEGQP